MTLYILLYSNDSALHQADHRIRAYTTYEKACAGLQQMLPFGLQENQCQVFEDDDVAYIDDTLILHHYYIVKKKVPDSKRKTIFCCDIYDTEVPDYEEVRLYWDENEAVEDLHRAEELYFGCKWEKIKELFFDNNAGIPTQFGERFYDPDYPNFFFGEQGLSYEDYGGIVRKWNIWELNIR